MVEVVSWLIVLGVIYVYIMINPLTLSLVKKRKSLKVDKSQEIKLRRTKKARECYICSCCGEYIKKGSIYYREVGLTNLGEFSTNKLHPECANFVQKKLNNFEKLRMQFFRSSIVSKLEKEKIWEDPYFSDFNINELEEERFK